MEFIFLESVSSTNDYLRNLSNKKEGLVVISDEQTNGKGRMGRKFVSQRFSGVYMSMLIKHKNPLQVPIYAALAVYNTLRRYLDDNLGIKWPNDILYDGKKICGILCESFIEKGQTYIILGIGININASFKDELSKTAISLYDITHFNLDNRELGMLVANEFQNICNEDFIGILAKYKENLLNINKEIKVINGTNEYIAKCIDINENGQLIIKTDEGISTLNSGQVSIRGVF